jgi:hypothetical protein
VTTTQQVIDRIRREFLGSRTEPINRLASDPGTGATLTFANELGGISEGARLSIELEDIHVWSTSTTTKTAECLRGFESTTNVAHATGTLVRVSPRVTDSQILVAINAHLRGLYGEGVYRMDAEEYAYNPSQSLYPLSSNVLEPYQIWAEDRSESIGWVKLYGWQMARNQNTTDFPSGNAIVFTREAPSAGFQFRITYRRELGTLTTLADNVETTTGTPAIDLLVLGAGMRLTRGRETARNLSDAQGSTRRAQEVPPGAELGSHRALQQAYQQELFRETARLAKLYPPESRQW